MKSLIVAAFLVASVAAGSFGGASFVGWQKAADSQKPRAGKGTLESWVQEAKARGKREVYVPTPIPYLPEVSSLEDALSRYTVVVATPVGKVTEVQDPYSLQTTYRFKVIETLVTNEPECWGCLAAIKVPDEYQQLLEDEILVNWSGGTLVLDGVKIINRSANFSGFQEGRQYLLFLSFDAARKLAVSNIEEYGVFELKSNDLLEPVTTKEHPIKQDLNVHYEKSLRLLKNALKSKGVQRHSEKSSPDGIPERGR